MIEDIAIRRQRQIASIKYMCRQLGRPVPEHIERISFGMGKFLIICLQRDCSEKRQAT
jgi:hypothetical protein